MAVFIPEPISAAAVAELERRVGVVGWDDPRVTRWPEEADGLIVRLCRVAGPDIESARRLKVIGKHGVGVDNIDVGAARRRAVRVVNTPGANTEAVAEMTLALALALARRVPLLDRLLRTGTLKDRDALAGRELRRKRLGVVGLGRIGQRVAALFRAALEMEVLGHDPYLPEDGWAQIGVRRLARLDDLLPEIDVLTLHLPLTAESEGLIGERELGLMPPGALLINTARGGIVDEAALFDVLRAGRLAGAASDVFVREPPEADHPLLGLPQFIATPHLAGLTEEAMERMALTVAEEVIAVLEGREPRHAVV